MTNKFLLLATVFNLDSRLVIPTDNIERKMFDIRLYFRVAELATNQTFGIEDTGDHDY